MRGREVTMRRREVRREVTMRGREVARWGRANTVSGRGINHVTKLILRGYTRSILRYTDRRRGIR